MSSTRELLVAQRKKLLEQLRAREPELVRDFESIEIALENMGPDPSASSLYTPFKSAIDAIAAYLERVMRTEEPEVIAQSIVDGGWLRRNPNALKNARSSLRYHLDKSAETKVLKKFPSGRVGLYSWPRDFDQA